MRTAISLILYALAFMGSSSIGSAQDYDLVITGGRVMDPETMYDSVANVGIKNGRIAVITKEAIAGKDEIDANGLVVAPGFIDTHVHGVDPVH